MTLKVVMPRNMRRTKTASIKTKGEMKNESGVISAC